MTGLRAILGLLLLGLAACGGDGSQCTEPADAGAFAGGSCNFTQSNVAGCYEFADSVSAVAGPGTCTGVHSTYQSHVACSSCGRTGGCRFTLSGVTETTWFYGVSSDQVRAGCAQAGQTYVAP